jgi:hypothetical protein
MSWGNQKAGYRNQGVEAKVRVSATKMDGAGWFACGRTIPQVFGSLDLSKV